MNFNSSTLPYANVSVYVWALVGAVEKPRQAGNWAGRWIRWCGDQISGSPKFPVKIPSTPYPVRGYPPLDIKNWAGLERGLSSSLLEEVGSTPSQPCPPLDTPTGNSNNLVHSLYETELSVGNMKGGN